MFHSNMADEQRVTLDLLHQEDTESTDLTTNGNFEAVDGKTEPTFPGKKVQNEDSIDANQTSEETRQGDEESSACLEEETKTESQEPVMVQSEGEIRAEDEQVVEPVLKSNEEASGVHNVEEKHISILKTLEDLEELADLHGTGKKPCPLCPEEKFKPCYSHKLRRHIQNLHWKVSVEFEDCRMCICHLTCRVVKPNQDGEQSLVRLGAHYHCIVCSATIARRTDMVSHIKRHMNKGGAKEKSCPEIMKEGGTNIQLLPNYSTPQKTETFFNPKMKMNRQLIFCTLAAVARIRKPVECLDAFGSTGIMGLQWAKHLGKAVKVAINDINEKSIKMILENCHINKIKVMFNGKTDDGDDFDDEEGNYCGPVEVTNMDANVIMHLRAFDFIHLDPFGTAVNFLDAAFRNVRHLGIVSVTSTDIGTLYSKSLNVAIRHYGCNIVRTEYYKELGARMVIAAIARAAARCNKGIEVLLTVAVEHFLLIVVRVLRGPTQADETVKKIRHLLHCQWCEERVFQKEGTMLEEKPYHQLPCDCQNSMPGKTAVQLGPLWSGSLFSTGFLRNMYFETMLHGLEELQPLLKTLICEAECTIMKQFDFPIPKKQSNQVNWRKEPDTEVTVVPLPALAAQTSVDCTPQVQDDTDEKREDEKSPVLHTTEDFAAGKRKRKNRDDQPGRKKQKQHAHTEHPPFYYSIHRHSFKGMNIPKLNKFLQYLVDAGFRGSRTHFDPTGVRTDASLQQFKATLMAHSTATHTGMQKGES
ncbi:TRMT1-like protein [Protopterus annectens]|uniref:TRMT1-like protein n=1 Tax=Protopterus annectens TaxID=7888 RepID=UPI001CF9AEBF|nr:TRMT1-like protein [Protopterus annectens]